MWQFQCNERRFDNLQSICLICCVNNLSSSSVSTLIKKIKAIKNQNELVLNKRAPPHELNFCYCMVLVWGINSTFTQQCTVVFYVYADLVSLLAVTSQYSVLMQLTGCHNGNELRNATCTDIQISIE